MTAIVKVNEDVEIYTNGLVNYDWVEGSDAEYEDDDDFQQQDGHCCPCCGHGFDSEAPSINESHAAEQQESSSDPQTESLEGQNNEQVDTEEVELGGFDTGTEVSQEADGGAECAQENSAGDEAQENHIVGEDGFELGLGNLPIPPRYYDWKEHFPFLQELLDNYEVIQNELEELTAGRWCPWPEYKLYQSMDQNGDWKVIPLMFTFPAWDASRSKLIENNCAGCPKTMEMLKKIEGLRTVLFSRLGPKTRLSSHQGWADLSNYVLRIHLPLVVPDSTKYPDSCGMWVEGEVQFHKARDFLVFDDSKYHKAFNASEEDRVVLIIDILRPSTVPKGLATGKHTEQLDDLIENYERSLNLNLFN